MSTTVAALLAHAANQLGNYERTGNNDIEYADYWGITGSAWCYAFVQWCFDTVGTGARLPYVCMYVPYGVQYSRDVFQSIERADAPRPGDIVHFTWDMDVWPPDRPGTGDHVGLVESWDGGDTITTIEGNVGSPQGVWRLRRSISATVINFWRPTVYSDIGDVMTPAQEQKLDSALTMLGWLLNDTKTPEGVQVGTAVGWLLNDTKTSQGLQVGPAVEQLATTVRRNTRVRLVKTQGDKLWVTDLINTFPVTADQAAALGSYGFFNNDTNDKGEIIPQAWDEKALGNLMRPDALGALTFEAAGSATKAATAASAVGGTLTNIVKQVDTVAADAAKDRAIVAGEVRNIAQVAGQVGGIAVDAAEGRRQIIQAIEKIPSGGEINVTESIKLATEAQLTAAGMKRLLAALNLLAQQTAKASDKPGPEQPPEQRSGPTTDPWH